MKRSLSALAAVLFIAAAVWAHGDLIHVMGTVAKIEGTTAIVKLSDGSTKSVVLDPETKSEKKGGTAKAADLTVGVRVVIHAKSVNGVLHAVEVRIGEAPKSAHALPEPPLATLPASFGPAAGMAASGQAS